MLILPLAGCQPPPEYVYVRNLTGQDLVIREGSADYIEVTADQTGNRIEVTRLGCANGQVRAVTADGRRVAFLDEPVCADSEVTIRAEDLVATGATATVINDTGAVQDLAIAGGERERIDPGERVVVDLGVPVGTCLRYSGYSWRFEPPDFWSGDLCDGEVRPLAVPESPAATVDNRTDRSIDVISGSGPALRVGPGTVAEVPLPEAECQSLRVLTADRTAVITPERLVCPLDEIVADEVIPAATALLVNHTDSGWTVTLEGPALTMREVSIAVGASEPVNLESLPGTCVLVESFVDRALEQRDWYSERWSGYLCDGSALTVDIVPGAGYGGAGASVWTLAWQDEPR